MTKHNTSATTSTAHYMETAVHIAQYLAKEAIWDDKRCNWIGHSLEPMNNGFQVVRKSFSRDFYNGTSGIAYFLATVLRYHDDPIVEETLEGCINQLLELDNQTDNLASNFGFFGGRMGVAYALIEAGRLRQRRDWEDAGFALLDQLCAAEIQDFELDVISGVAGGIPVLLKYYRETKKTLYLQTAIRCGDFLLEKAVKKETSWEWHTSLSPRGLTGYSHGNAGMALALLELHAVTSEPKYYAAAMYGFNFERLTFNPSVQNWPDLRTMPGSPENAAPTYAESWCHGAPGIALTRLRAWELSGDMSFKQEAEAALSTTYRGVYNMITQHSDTANYSLCHGMAGNADILLCGGQKLENPLYGQLAAQAAEAGIEKFDKTGLSWPSGVNDPSGVTKGMGETPGFMLGLAGTGYFYLRLYAPEEVDSLLIL
ncbi:MAG: lanthionine synthetase LanC family protein [Saprospiraceae bacterium]|nr:lanthionine synthetase LanC family protein [Saprospiraceae bacterium]